MIYPPALPGYARLDMALTDVRSFHKAVGARPSPYPPAAQDAFLRDRRADFIQSEVEELREAGDDIVKQADAYLDVIYFAMGGFDELGIDPSPLWEIVHAANMAKVDPRTGQVTKHPVTNKIMKPEGWEDPGPKLAAEIARQIAASRADLAAAEA